MYLLGPELIYNSMTSVVEYQFWDYKIRMILV